MRICSIAFEKFFASRRLRINDFFRKLIFECAVQNLASGGSGHVFIGDKRHSAWAFEASQSIATPLTYLCFGRIVAFVQHHNSKHAFAPVLVGHTNDSDIFD